MRIKLALFSLLLLFSFLSNAQVIDSLSEVGGDTIETIVTDTSIIYVIKAPPVTIREKLEVLKIKLKPKYFFSTSFGLVQFFELKKAKSGYQEYLNKINSSTQNRLGYSIGISIWEHRNKIFSGFSFYFLHLPQKFEYYSKMSSKSYSIDNNSNYQSIGFHLGYVLKEKKKNAFIVYGGIHLDNLLSYSGRTLIKKHPNKINQLKDEITYREYLMTFSINLKYIITTSISRFEIEPFILLSPFSATIKKEAYSIQRSFIGIKLGFNNKLF